MPVERPEAVLFVSYPMFPVSDASCGGAEQMLWVLERELTSRGVHTTVAACEGSSVAGRLFSTGASRDGDDGFALRAAEHCEAVVRATRQYEFDLIHDKSGLWWPHAAEITEPVLATLHLPRQFYSEKLFRSIPPNVFFNCVSRSQARGFEDLPRMLGVVGNGIPLERFRFTRKKADYVLWMGRICPEKAPHLAMDAAQQAGAPLVMCGQVYPFEWHRLYFEQEVRPRLERYAEHVRWVEKPTFEQKVNLLAHSRVVLLPTLAPETSSLVAMEAAACGTPVIAFPNGAIPEIVEHGVTGFLVHDRREMAHAIADVDQLWPEDARARAEERFSAKAMADGYERLYAEVMFEAGQVKSLAA